MEKYDLSSFKNVYAKKNDKAIHDKFDDQADLFGGAVELDHIAD